MAQVGPTKLARMRLYRRLQQAELARMAGLSERKLRMLETGEVDDPKLRDLVNLALVLDCELGDLVEDDWLSFRGERSSDVTEPDRLELPESSRDPLWGPDKPVLERVSRGVQAHHQQRRRGETDAVADEDQ